MTARITVGALALTLTAVGCYGGDDPAQASGTTADAADTTTAATTAATTTAEPDTTGAESSTGEAPPIEGDGLGELGYTAEDARTYLAEVAPMVRCHPAAVGSRWNRFTHSARSSASGIGSTLGGSTVATMADTPVVATGVVAGGVPALPARSGASCDHCAARHAW